jgi:hypothetical protein
MFPDLANTLECVYKVRRQGIRRWPHSLKVAMRASLLSARVHTKHLLPLQKRRSCARHVGRYNVSVISVPADSVATNTPYSVLQSSTGCFYQFTWFQIGYNILEIWSYFTVEFCHCWLQDIKKHGFGGCHSDVPFTWTLTFEAERKRVGKNSRKVQAKKKLWGRRETIYY